MYSAKDSNGNLIIKIPASQISSKKQLLQNIGVNVDTVQDVKYSPISQSPNQQFKQSLQGVAEQILQNPSMVQDYGNGRYVLDGKTPITDYLSKLPKPAPILPPAGGLIPQTLLPPTTIYSPRESVPINV